MGETWRFDLLESYPDNNYVKMEFNATHFAYQVCLLCCALLVVAVGVVVVVDDDDDVVVVVDDDDDDDSLFLFRSVLFFLSFFFIQGVFRDLATRGLRHRLALFFHRHIYLVAAVILFLLLFILYQLLRCVLSCFCRCLCRRNCKPADSTDVDKDGKPKKD
jgi:hypothetical protein